MVLLRLSPIVDAVASAAASTIARRKRVVPSDPTRPLCPLVAYGCDAVAEYLPEGGATVTMTIVAPSSVANEAVSVRRRGGV